MLQQRCLRFSLLSWVGAPILFQLVGACDSGATFTADGGAKDSGPAEVVRDAGTSSFDAGQVDYGQGTWRWTEISDVGPIDAAFVGDVLHAFWTKTAPSEVWGGPLGSARKLVDVAVGLRPETVAAASFGNRLVLKLSGYGSSASDGYRTFVTEPPYTQVADFSALSLLWHAASENGVQYGASGSQSNEARLWRWTGLTVPTSPELVVPPLAGEARCTVRALVADARSAAHALIGCGDSRVAYATNESGLWVTKVLAVDVGLPIDLAIDPSGQRLIAAWSTVNGAQVVRRRLGEPWSNPIDVITPRALSVPKLALDREGRALWAFATPDDVGRTTFSVQFSWAANDEVLAPSIPISRLALPTGMRIEPYVTRILLHPTTGTPHVVFSFYGLGPNSKGSAGLLSLTQ
jgi:hypothetical protein